MKKINVEQGTQEWADFRKGKIGASYSGTILGVNPYDTPLQLWNRLMQGIETADNKFMKRGRELEPIAREWLNQRGFLFKPMVVQHDIYDWMIASLDGFDGECVLEIKCPSKIEATVPPNHFAQLQHQLAVTGVHEAIYLQFDGKEGKLTSVVKDEDYIAKLIKAEVFFYNCLITYTQPSPTERDVHRLADDRNVIRFTNLKNLDAHIKMLEKEFSILKKEIVSDLDYPIVECNGVKFTKIMRRGAIDYDAIPELQGVSKDQYRKNAIDSWRLSYGD